MGGSVLARRAVATLAVSAMELRMALGTAGIFGARGAMGLAAQMVVGLVAGVVFATLSVRRMTP